LTRKTTALVDRSVVVSDAQRCIRDDDEVALWPHMRWTKKAVVDRRMVKFIVVVGPNILTRPKLWLLFVLSNKQRS
jgi:hypothetical protein